MLSTRISGTHKTINGNVKWIAPGELVANNLFGFVRRLLTHSTRIIDFCGNHTYRYAIRLALKP